jgi:hypothetical protein
MEDSKFSMPRALSVQRMLMDGVMEQKMIPTDGLV